MLSNPNKPPVTVLGFFVKIIYVKFFNIMSFRMFLTFVVLMVSTLCGSCENVSPTPGLKSFRQDYKNIEETCLAVGFVKNNCRNDPKTSKTSEGMT